MKVTHRWLACAAIIICIAGCNNPPADGPRQSEASTPAAPKGSTNSASGEVDPLDPQDFVTKVGETYMYELAAAQIALERTRSNEMRRFANRIVADHRNSARRLKNATVDGTELVVPEAPNETQLARLEALRSAPSFDSAYLQQQRRAHEETLGDLRRFAAGGTGEKLKIFAADAARMMDDHRQMLRAIEVSAGHDGRTDLPASGRTAD